jgi:hypothetical protein
MHPELDIVVYGVQAKNASSASKRANDVFAAAAKRDLHLALITLPASMVSHYWPDLNLDQESVTCLRSCLMKPEHLEWVGNIAAILEDAAA